MPSELCGHLNFYCPSSAWKRISEAKLLELHLISQHPRAFPDITGGSNCQKETPPKINIVFMEIVEEKVVLG